MTDAPLDARQPGLLELIADPRAMTTWEAVRLHRRPVSAATLSAAMERELQDVQAQVDRLVVAGLLRAVPARRAHRSTRYAVTRQHLVVACDFEDEAIRARLLADRERLQGAYFEELLARHADHAADPRTSWRFGCWGTARVGVDDLRELARRVRAVTSFVELLSERRATEAEDPLTASTPNHAISIRIEPLRGPVMSQPTIDMIPLGQVEQAAKTHQQVHARLSDRERQVAEALAQGLSRQDIARTLGVTLNTVGTLARRLYRKIGVRSRAQLAALVSAPPPHLGTRAEAQ
jgi:DNA-binding CsgD family transcriptional regulator